MSICKIVCAAFCVYVMFVRLSRRLSRRLYVRLFVCLYVLLQLRHIPGLTKNAYHTILINGKFLFVQFHTYRKLYEISIINIFP